MSLVIDDPRVEALARALAQREGLTPAEAIARALAAQLGTQSSPPAASAEARAAALARLAALQADIARRYPAEQAPLPWETVKRWAEDEPEEDDASAQRA